MSSKYILGISAFYHDSAAVLIKDDDILLPFRKKGLVGLNMMQDSPDTALNNVLNKIIFQLQI